MKKGLGILFTSCMLLNGCSTVKPVDIKGSDNRVNFQGGEISHVFGSGKSEKKKEHYATVTAGYFRGEGHFNQRLDSGDTAALDTGAIDGPATLNNTAKIELTYLRGDYHSYFNNAFEWHVGFGLGYLAMTMDSETASQRASTSQYDWEMAAELGLAYYFTPPFGIDGSVGLYINPLLSATSERSFLHESHLQLFIEPIDSVRLFAGYRSWSYEYDNYDSFYPESPITLTFSGPTAGVALRF